MSDPVLISRSARENAKSLVNDSALSLFGESGVLIGDLAKEQIVTTLRRMNLGLFRLVVMGEIKKGKSSFINALIGEADLLPTSSDVATSAVFKVIHGPSRKYKVFFLQMPKRVKHNLLLKLGEKNSLTT